MAILPPAEVTGLILAGGASRRFGSDKSRAEAAPGVPFLQAVGRALEPHASRILVSLAAGGADPGAPPGWTLVRDVRADAGPLAGIEAGFAQAATPVVFVAACDYPFLRSGDVARLLETLAAHPANAVAMPVVEGRAHPLCAAWRRAPALEALPAWFDSGRREATRFARSLGACEVPLAGEEASGFRNVNVPEDLRRIAP